MARPTAQISAARLRPRLTRRLASRTDAYFRDFGRRLVVEIRPELERAAARFETKDVSSEVASSVEGVLRTFGWDAEARKLYQVVRPVLELVGVSAAEAVGSELGVDASFDLFARPVLLRDVATRVVDIPDTSRDALRRLIGDGLSKGLSVEQIVKGVPPGTANIRGPVPAFDGIRGLVDSWTSTGAGRILGGGTGIGSRSYLIALTETANAWNVSAIESYRGLGVDFVEVFDGADCGWTSHDDPDLAHGSVRLLENARRQPLSHPRCQRAFGAATRATKPSPAPNARPSPAGPVREFSSHEEAAAWLDATMPKVGQTPIGEQRGWLLGYTQGAYEQANGLLRLGEDGYRRAYSGVDYLGNVLRGRNTIAAMDQAMSPMPFGTTVHRAIWDTDAFAAVVKPTGLPAMTDRFAAELPKLVGQTVQEKGFLSTSVGPDVVNSYTALPIRLHLSAPAGTRAAWMRPVSTFQEENELVLDRGIRYVVTRVEKRVTSVHQGPDSDIWHVYGTILP